MNKKVRLISAICLMAQAFTSLVLSIVYANKKKELSHAFLGFGILGGLGGAYLLYKDYQESKAHQLAYDGEDWGDEDVDDTLFDENSADDINFTIAEDENTSEEEKTEEEEKPE